MSLSKAQKTKIEKAIDQHDRHKKSYFWRPAASASQRRWVEGKNTWGVKFKHAGKVYEYASRVTCSARKYYYEGAFRVDGATKTVRAFKKLLPPS